MKRTEPSRAQLGEKVREIAVAWSLEDDDRPGAGLQSWAALDEATQELYMRVGEELFTLGKECAPNLAFVVERAESGALYVVDTPERAAELVAAEVAAGYRPDEVWTTALEFERAEPRPAADDDVDLDHCQHPVWVAVDEAVPLADMVAASKAPDVVHAMCQVVDKTVRAALAAVGYPVTPR
ncbi:hypothetical protein NQK81_13395 [Amycolatopsis roodepoortensis]|uniref:hypothetical protein n=1 Tax=Amycolatopsis roodepoortensis TaxID=700274 RepID=UPI00214D11F0|nr:hypothetical protein [Amycolatopsis roodepoortensis]UUV34400.1 hypothetical protein NQK81_13395 [Amycolatopsis roodepoortensis]